MQKQTCKKAQPPCKVKKKPQTTNT